MIVGTLVVRYRDPRLANETIKRVPQDVYQAMVNDLQMGEYSRFQAFDFPTASNRQVSIVKSTILSVSFTPTGEAKSITLPNWVHTRLK